MKRFHYLRILLPVCLACFVTYEASAQCTEAKDADMAKYKRLTETQDAQGCSQCAMLSLYFCSAKYCATAEDKRKVGSMITACKRNIQNMGQPYCCPELVNKEPQWGSMVGNSSASAGTGQSSGSSGYANPLIGNSSSSSADSDDETLDQATELVKAAMPLLNQILDPDATGQGDVSPGLANSLSNYRAPSTSYSDNQALNTATELVNAATPLINQISANMQARREEEERLRLEQLKKEQEAAAAKARWLELISNRKKLITKFPDGKTPLSSQPKTVKEVFFFVYSHEPSAIESNNPVLHVSNVFSLPRYEDGTWQFKTGLMENIQKTVKGLNLTLSGFYTDKASATDQQQYLLSKAGNYGFTLKSISYTSKKVSPASGETDYWGNPNTGTKTKTDQTTNSNKQDVKLDFWGNPIKD